MHIVQSPSNHNMKLTMTIKELLSSSSTKSSLTTMFANALLKHFSSVADFKLVVVYGTTIKDWKSSMHMRKLTR